MVEESSVPCSGFTVEAPAGLLRLPGLAPKPPKILKPLAFGSGFVAAKVGFVLLEIATGGLVASFVGFVLLEITFPVPEKI